MDKDFLIRIMENHKLTGPNYKDWLRNLRMVLDFKQIGYVLEAPLPVNVDSTANQAEQEAFETWKIDNIKAREYIMLSMNRELQTKFENVSTAYEIFSAVDEIYKKNSRLVKYELCASLFKMKLREGIPPGDHIIKMINKIEELDAYGMSMPDCLKVNLILQSLPSSYQPLITIYLLNRIEPTLPELLNEIQFFYKQTEKGKGQENVFIASTSKANKRLKWQQKGPKVGPKKKLCKKEAIKAKKVMPKGKCFHCGVDGHWKRNCRKYLESLEKTKAGTKE